MIQFQQEFINMIFTSNLKPRLRKSIKKSKRVTQIKMKTHNDVIISNYQGSVDALHTDHDSIQNQIQIMMAEEGWEKSEDLKAEILRLIKYSAQKIQNLASVIRNLNVKLQKSILDEHSGRQIKLIDNQNENEISYNQICESVDQQFRQSFTQSRIAINENEPQYEQILTLPVYADFRDNRYLHAIANSLLHYKGGLADVLILDFPWPINSTNKKGKDFITYDTMSIQQLFQMDLSIVQSQGLLFFWVVNAKKVEAYEYLHSQSYKVVDEIDWIKTKKNSNEICPGIGTYTLHAKETCLLARKGTFPHKENLRKFADVVVQSRGRQHSQKPWYIHEMAETMWPNGIYCEFFARWCNLRPNWMSGGTDFKRHKFLIN